LIISRKSSIIAVGGENMIKTYAMLVDELKDYANPTSKIRRLVAGGELISVVRGLYETDKDVPGYYLAGSIYGPSYLSFEFALGYHSLIPEAVYQFTSATFEKKRQKQYATPYGTFTYRDVPSDAYPYGVELHEENGYSFQIASPEKALCDQLYTISPVKNCSGLEELLFHDLRIDGDAFQKLNMLLLTELTGCYHTQNHRLLCAYIKKGAKL
jgi:predicted transcriptional regulator of viral defense system